MTLLQRLERFAGNLVLKRPRLSRAVVRLVRESALLQELLNGPKLVDALNGNAEASDSLGRLLCHPDLARKLIRIEPCLESIAQAVSEDHTAQDHFMTVFRHSFVASLDAEESQTHPDQLQRGQAMVLLANSLVGWLLQRPELAGDFLRKMQLEPQVWRLVAEDVLESPALLELLHHSPKASEHFLKILGRCELAGRDGPLQAVLGNPSSILALQEDTVWKALVHFLSQDEVLDRLAASRLASLLLSSPALASRMCNNDRNWNALEALLQRQSVAARLVVSHTFFALLRQPELEKSLLHEDGWRVLAPLLMRPEFLQRLSASQFAVRFLAEEGLASAVSGQEEKWAALAGLLSRSAITGRMAGDIGLLGTLLKAPSTEAMVLREELWPAFATLLLQPNVLARLASSAFAGRYLAQEGLAATLVTQEETWDAFTDLLRRSSIAVHVAKDPGLWPGLLAAEGAEKAVTNPQVWPAFVALLSKPGVVERLASSAFAGVYLGQQNLAPALLVHPAAWTGFQNLLLRQSIASRVADLPEIWKALLSAEGSEVSVTDPLVWPHLVALLSRTQVLERLSVSAFAGLYLSQQMLAPTVVVQENAWQAFVSLLSRASILDKLLQTGQAAPLLARIRADDTVFSSEGVWQEILQLLEKTAVLQRLAQEPVWLQHALRVPAFLEALVTHEDRMAQERLPALISFEQKWRQLRDWIDTDRPDLPERLQRGRLLVEHERELRRGFFEALVEEDRLRLRHGDMRLPDAHAFWVQLHEILLDQEYFFETDTTQPRILDCGAHLGLSLYYFKTRFPGARITAFEPVPELRRIAEENICRNGFTGIELLPYALAGSPGANSFFLPDEDSMGGSIASGYQPQGKFSSFQVECTTLSTYLTEPVHFLKLDIEGTEDQVLSEAAERLHLVQHLFCEFHQRAGEGPERLAGMLALLSNSGFDVQLSKSYSYQSRTHVRPMQHVGEAYSLVLWARNKQWPPQG